ncbi:hypothetical protein ACERII_13870 [Evansella sp. AB-rgal1]|uniref:hypothetical protein n=1 Tax=Evansella sp. AB-rgal1 TaxID=3242696 RepID=UPI00359E624C
MKKKMFSAIMVLFLLAMHGCSLIEENITGASVHNEFQELEPSAWVEYTPLVQEYFYYRTQAVLHNDIDVLWNRYPHLSTGSSVETGVNSESYEVTSLIDVFELIDANVAMEGFGRLRANQVSEQELILLANSGIEYVTHDFDVTGGEILIELHFRYEDNEWVLIKTDEYTLPEYKEFIKNNK